MRAKRQKRQSFSSLPNAGTANQSEGKVASSAEAENLKLSQVPSSNVESSSVARSDKKGM